MRTTTMLLLLAAAAAVPGPAAEPPPGPVPQGRFDPAWLDRSVSPCTDFYQFACGGWMRTHPIPPDESSWSIVAELSDRNRETLKSILEKAAVASPARTPVEQKIGDYYAACMDEAGIEARGVASLQPVLERIAGVQTRGELPSLVAYLHAAGVPAFFDMGSQQDYRDATSMIAMVDASGMGLPDRDYYLADDKKGVRDEYVAHVRRMLELSGDAPDAAAAAAQAVLRIETALARGALDRTSRRDPAKTYDKKTAAELAALTPSFSWKAYLAAAEAPAVSSLNVMDVGFVRALEEQLKTASLADLRTYLRWQTVHASAALLPKAFVEEDFAFFGRTLTGARELRPRWKRCVDATDAALGEAVGQKYVEAAFAGQSRARMAQMVADLRQALARDIDALPWMTPATRKQAQAKLQTVADKIGHPERWRDYGSVRVTRADALGNHQRAAEHEERRQLSRIGRPLDRGEWLMTPATLNAYYEPSMNDINFPAAILQPPFFDAGMDDAINYGAIGSVIGHELTHGFDDQGRKFDAKGNLRDWWTAADAAEFEKRAACFVKQYGEYAAVPGANLDGRLTLGENAADNGGVRIGYMALQQRLAQAGAKKDPIDGLTPQQRFFVGWASFWCQNRTDELEKLYSRIEVHSPGRFRVNGVVSNLPEFQEAFSCPAGAPMVRADACRVW